MMTEIIDSACPFISIIVPCYKSEKYLPVLVNCLQSQAYKDWELILVDDGSPDNTGDLCDSYALKDRRIVSIHKIIGGISSA